MKNLSKIRRKSIKNWVALWDRAQDIGTLKILIIIIKNYTKQVAVRPFGASLSANRTKKTCRIQPWRSRGPETPKKIKNYDFYDDENHHPDIQTSREPPNHRRNVTCDVRPKTHNEVHRSATYTPGCSLILPGQFQTFRPGSGMVLAAFSMDFEWFLIDFWPVFGPDFSGNFRKN